MYMNLKEKKLSQYSISQEFSQVEDTIGSADDLSSGPVNSTEEGADQRTTDRRR